jgi:RNA 2',3'-cyclic 3'-phosphodiesterase
MKHRSFIAIFPSKNNLERIADVQSKLKNFGWNVRWESFNKFHITVQFWGDQHEDWINDVHNYISDVCSHHHPFTIQLIKVGCFPNLHSPKIFWIGSQKDENTELLSLVDSIYAATSHFGSQAETKPFHSHITLGRGKGKISSSLIQNLESIDFVPIEIKCSELRIMKSSLASTGSTYTTLFTIPLK